VRPHPVRCVSATAARTLVAMVGGCVRRGGTVRAVQRDVDDGTIRGEVEVVLDGHTDLRGT